MSHLIRTRNCIVTLAVAMLMATACYPVGGASGPRSRPTEETTPAVNAFIDEDQLDDDEQAAEEVDVAEGTDPDEVTTTSVDGAGTGSTDADGTSTTEGGIQTPPTTAGNPTTTAGGNDSSSTTTTDGSTVTTAATTTTSDAGASSTTSMTPTTPVTSMPTTTTTAAPPSGSATLPFGPFVMPEGNYAAQFSGGWIRVVPEDLYEQLDAARAAGRSVAVNFVRSKKYSQNSDGTFNLDKWKGMVDLYAQYDIDEYIEDGTILVHYLLDEPKARSEWGGEVIPNDVIDEMARYSKARWPNLATTVRVQPTKLAKHADGYGQAHPGGWTWSYLDAGWGQYSARKGPIEQFVAEEVAEANAQGIGLVFGMNVLNGGAGPDESFGWNMRGYDSSSYTMSPEELRRYGTTMMDSPLACAVVMWRYYDDGTFRYFDLPEIRDAMVDLSAHASTRDGRPCRP